MTYTNARYSFTNPTPKRKYIKYLVQIAKCNANGFNPTRKQVQIALGDPDPTRIVGYDSYWKKNVRSNWGISRWTAMKQAGLIRSERASNVVRYQITGDGLLLLHSVM